MYSHDDIYIFFLLTCFAKFHRNQFRNAIEYLLAVTIRVNFALKSLRLKKFGLKDVDLFCKLCFKCIVHVFFNKDLI